MLNVINNHAHTAFFGFLNKRPFVWRLLEKILTPPLHLLSRVGRPRPAQQRHIVSNETYPSIVHIYLYCTRVFFFFSEPTCFPPPPPSPASPLLLWVELVRRAFAVVQDERYRQKLSWCALDEGERGLLLHYTMMLNF